MFYPILISFEFGGKITNFSMKHKSNLQSQENHKAIHYLCIKSITISIVYMCCTMTISKYISVHVDFNSVFVNTARQAFGYADKTILLYIIVGVNH